MQFVLFTDNIKDLTVREACRAAKKAGFDGLVPMPAFFARLKQIAFDGVVSFHSEYKGSTSVRVMTTLEMMVQSAADLAFIKRLVAKQ